MLHLTRIPDRASLDRSQLIAAYSVALADAQTRGDWNAARLLAYRLQTLRQPPTPPSPTLRQADALVEPPPRVTVDG